MIKDFYNDVLKMFPRKIDQRLLKNDHKFNPNHWVASSDDIFFAIDTDEIINGIDFMKRVLKVSKKAWVADDAHDDATNETILSFIDNSWYDLQYYHWYSPVHYLYKMDINSRYEPMPRKLVDDYHDANWYLKKKGHVNKHVKQRQAYENFIKENGIHDLESARDYLLKRDCLFDKVPINKPFVIKEVTK